jgi:uncharacterized membrane protein required for colicin V production
MSIPALDSNIIVIAILVVVTLYGAMAGVGRLRTLILSIFVGVVLSEQLSAVAAPHLQIFGNDNVPILLFAAPIILFGFSLGRQHGHDRGSTVAVLLLGLLTGCLIVSAALHVMPASLAQSITDGSFVAMNLSQFHLYLIAGLPLAALVGPLFKKKSRSHH